MNFIIWHYKELPGHVPEDCFTAERELVRWSWQKWLVEEIKYGIIARKF
ncbi:hypothetical protein ACLK19_20350 [Escherichia coli]